MATKRKGFMIKNLIPGLVERGKIKIGIKGEWRKSGGGKDFQLPKKLDHFVVTGALRDDSNNFIKDNEIHKTLGPEPKELPIYLLYNDIEMNFQTRYAFYWGAKLWCSGDGEAGKYLQKDGSRKDCICPCQRQEPTYTGKDKCKIHGTLAVIIQGADVVGGVWKFRTTSYNSVVQTLGSLTLIKRVSGGYLAGLPLWLTLRPKTVTSPADGRVQTVYVVGIEFRGNMAQLQAAGYKHALNDAKHELRIEHIEDEAKRLISPDAASVTETAAEIEDEFHPEAAQARGPKPPPAKSNQGLPPLADPDQPPETTEPPPVDGPGHGPDGQNGAGPQDQPPPADSQPPPAKPKRGRPARKKVVKPPAEKTAAPPAGPQAPPTDSPTPPLAPPADAPADSQAGPAAPAPDPAADNGKKQIVLF